MKIQRKTAGLLAFALCAACLAALLLYLAFLRQPKSLQYLDNLAYDAMMRLLPAKAPNPAVAIVDIDEASLARIGQWPWPRSVLADLAGKLLDGGAAAIGFDMLLAEPDRTSPAAMAREIERLTGKKADLSGLAPDEADNDLRFKEAIADKPVVLGAFANRSGPEAFPEKMPESAPFVSKNEPGAPDIHASMTALSSLAAPLPLFDATVGVFNAILSGADGAARAVPLLARAGDGIVAPLSLATLQKALGRPLRLNVDANGLVTLRIGKNRFPLEPDGTYRPIFRGPGHTFPYYSAADILDGALPPESVAGKILFVGSSAAGLRDFRKTPFDAEMPGVELHATVVDNILSGEGIRLSHDQQYILAAVVCIAAFCSSLLVSFAPIFVYAAGLCLLTGCVLGASFFCFRDGLFISPVLPVAAILLLALVCLPARHFLYDRQSRRLKSAFSRYLAPEVVERVVAAGGEPLAGSRKEVTIMFTDVRNFTSISESIAPERLVPLLNAYFKPMTACVTSSEGTVDKFIGDALMAFWNAPIDVKEHQLKAVGAALAMQARLSGLRPDFLRDFGVDLHMGAGLNCGECQVGNMGTAELLDYTCIGDNVNLASRLEGLCKVYGRGVIVSGSVRQACGDAWRFRLLDRVRVKGKNAFVEIYSPFANDEPVDEGVEKDWREALDAWFAGGFAQASKLFAKLAAHPSTETGGKLFLERCQKMLANPPAQWSGVWKFDSK